MKAFYSDPKIKKKYINRVKAHRLADNLIRCEGWNGTKGCAVGCTLEAYEHKRYETELGIPEWLARVEDRLFEGMTELKSRTWPEKFLSAIKPGAKLESVKGKFLIVVLKSALKSFNHKKYPKIKASVDSVIALWNREDIDSDKWKKDAAAAYAYAYAAYAAAADSVPYSPHILNMLEAAYIS